MADDDSPPACLFCGEAEHVAVHEVWGHEWMFETCCEGLHEQILIEMADDPAWARRFMQHLEVESLCGHRLRRIADDGSCGLVLDWSLDIQPIAWGAARSFVARHHAHCRPPVTWRFHTGIFNGRTLLGVALVGNPVARALAGRGMVEVNRLCIRRDTPKALRWNAASMLYGWCAREAAQQGWQKIITYTRADEAGTSLIAAGWKKDGVTRGRGWHSAGRARSNTNSWIGKVRWSRELAPKTRTSTGAAPGRHQTAATASGRPPDFGDAGDWTRSPPARASHVAQTHHRHRRTPRPARRAADGDQRELQQGQLAMLAQQPLGGQHAAMGAGVAGQQPQPSWRRLPNAPHPWLPIGVLSAHAGT